MSSLRVSVAAIERAAKLAGPAGDQVRRVLFADAGRPLPPEVPAERAEGAPMSTYDSRRPATGQVAAQNAAPEGAPAPETTPESEPAERGVEGFNEVIRELQAEGYEVETVE